MRVASEKDYPGLRIDLQQTVKYFISPHTGQHPIQDDCANRIMVDTKDVDSLRPVPGHQYAIPASFQYLTAPRKHPSVVVNYQHSCRFRCPQYHGLCPPLLVMHRTCSAYG